MTVGLMSCAAFQGPTGRALLNLGGVDIGLGGEGQSVFVDFMKTAAVGTQTPTVEFDADMYPIGSGGSLTSNYQCNLKIPASQQVQDVTDWVITFPATRTFSFVVNQPVDVIAKSNTAAGSTAVGTSGTMTCRGNGTAGYMQFRFNSASPTNSVNCYFESGAHYNSVGQTGDIKIMRLSDTTFTGGTYIAKSTFTPEFIANLTALNPKTLRPMGWTLPQNSGYANDVKWGYRSGPTAISYNSYRVIATAYGGAVSLSGSAYTMASNPTDSSAAGWVDGEVLQGASTSASSSCSITSIADNGSGKARCTLNNTRTIAVNDVIWIQNASGTPLLNGLQTVTAVSAGAGGTIDIGAVSFVATGTGNIGFQTITVTGKTGTKYLADAAGYPLHTQGGSTDGVQVGVNTFIYDGLLDRVLVNQSGINSSVPIEKQVELANLMKMNLWTCIPFMANDDYITNHIAYPLANLNPALNLYVEYHNEIWNNIFPTTALAYNRGAVVGWSSTADGTLHGYMALRYSQIIRNIETQWKAGRGGTLNGLKRVIAFKCFGTQSQIIPKRLKGSQLDGSATNYNSLGYANYSSAPNRPIDHCDVLAYATYFSGSCLTANGSFYSSSHTDVVTFLQQLANDWSANNTATALANIDADLRTGTGPNVNNTLQGFSSSATWSDSPSNGVLGTPIGVYPMWTLELGLQSITQPIELYEGGLESLAPTATNCTSMGITCSPPGGGAATAAGASAQITAALEAYKNSAYGSALVSDQFSQARTGGVSTPAWLSLSGPSVWSFYLLDVYSPAVPYQTFYGFANWR